MANCAVCGCELPNDSLQGHCPDCLLKVGLQSGTREMDPTIDSGQGKDSYKPPTAEELNRQLPQLEVLELLGYGGMGAVYKAKQKSLDRLVALKVIKAELADVGGFADRFEREAKALAKLNHPNIVGVHEFGEVGGQFYLVMEYVDGTDLRQLMSAGDLQPAQALCIVPQICEALQYAHDLGIVHRDVKPENILIDARGQVKIADFGLAKLIGESNHEQELTATNQVMGTLKYMAPEQMEGSATIDHRADIYSLGVVFYELLTGELPLGRFVAPSQKAEVDKRLDEIVMRALEKELPQRYQHASDLKVEVEKISDSEDPDQPQQVAGQDATEQGIDSAPGDSKSELGSVETHVRILAAINLAFGALFTLVALFLMIFLPSMGAVSQDEEAIRVLSIVGGAAGALVFLLLALPELAVGWGMWNLRPWSRYGGILLGAINLVNFPFGTLLGVYTLWVLVPEKNAALFRDEQYYI